MIESIVLTAARVCTFEQQRLLTNASSFFFERDERLFLVTTRHVMIDEPSNHFPDRIEIELHIDPDNMVKSTGFSIPLCPAEIARATVSATNRIEHETGKPRKYARK